MKVPFDIKFVLGTVPKSTEEQEEEIDETEFIFAYIGIP